MVFSSSIFLFAFLPFVLFLVFIGPKNGEHGVTWRNTMLAIASFIFYAWGEPIWVVPLFLLAWFNYCLGKYIEKLRYNLQCLKSDNLVFAQEKFRIKRALFLGIVCNIGLLAVVKYGIWIVNQFLKITFYPSLSFTPDPIVLESFHLPLGVSFFTFQATSYLIDIYRGDVQAAKRYIDFSCYLTMFSQLVAGPIVRYADIAHEIGVRMDNASMFYAGIKRFIIGLAKKILIANQLALIADWVFQLPHDSLSASLAWIGILAYAMQIYFDFSAYSDMAIGIGLMFGFNYHENFKHPYAACSMQDFWRRWHISLSSWLRDYLYIPLGGSRGTKLRTYINLLIVFFICGLWHGAALAFIVWGLWHGLFLVLERSFLGRYLNMVPKFFQHIYVWCVFLVGWVFFRTENMLGAYLYLQSLVGFGEAGVGSIVEFASNNVYYVLLLLVAIFISFGWVTQKIVSFYDKIYQSSATQAIALELVCVLFGVFLCVFCGIFILTESYNPFIYFRF